METVLNGILKKNELSSLKFRHLNLSADIPESYKLYMLQITEAYVKMYQVMQKYQ